MREEISIQKNILNETIIDFVRREDAKIFRKKIGSDLYCYVLNFNNEEIAALINESNNLQYLQEAYPDGLELWYKGDSSRFPEASFYEIQFKTALDSIYESAFSLLLEEANQMDDEDSHYKFDIYANGLYNRYLRVMTKLESQLFYQEDDSQLLKTLENEVLHKALNDVIAFQSYSAWLISLFSGKEVGEMVEAISLREQTFMYTDFSLQDFSLEGEPYFEAAMNARNTFKRDLMTIALTEEGQYCISFYDRHTLLIESQRLELGLSGGESNYFPTATAHNPNYLLANSARGYQAIVCPETGAQRLISRINRHGSPSPNEMYQQKIISTLGARPEATLRTYYNMQQHLMNCRLDKIKELLEMHNIPYSPSAILTLAEGIGDIMNRDFIVNEVDFVEKRNEALTFISNFTIDKKIENVLTDHIDQLLLISNTHIHLITATGVTNFTPKSFINGLFDKDKQEWQGRDCRIAQYATQFITPESDAGYWELILPVNSLAEDTNKSRGNNLVGLVFMFKSLFHSTELFDIRSIISEYDNFLTQWKETCHSARYYIERVEKAHASGELSDKSYNSYLESKRKEFKESEKALHVVADKCFQEIALFLNRPEEAEELIDAKVSLTQKAAMAVFTIACNLYGQTFNQDLSKQYNGFMQVYLMAALNLMERSVSFGCKSANDRAFFIALLSAFIDRKVDAFLLQTDDLAWNEVFQHFTSFLNNFGAETIKKSQEHHFIDISALHTRLDRSSFPKTGKDLLPNAVKVFSSLKDLAAHKRKSKIKKQKADEAINSKKLVLYYLLDTFQGGVSLEKALFPILTEWTLMPVYESSENRFYETANFFIDKLLLNLSLPQDDFDEGQTLLVLLCSHFFDSLKQIPRESINIERNHFYLAAYSEVLENLLVTHILFQMNNNVLASDNIKVLIDFLRELTAKTAAHNLREIRTIFEHAQYEHLNDEEKIDLAPGLLAKFIFIAKEKARNTLDENKVNKSGLSGFFGKSMHRSEWRVKLYNLLATLINDTDSNQKIENILEDPCFQEINQRDDRKRGFSFTFNGNPRD